MLRNELTPPCIYNCDSAGFFTQEHRTPKKYQPRTWKWQRRYSDIPLRSHQHFQVPVVNFRAHFPPKQPSTTRWNIHSLSLKPWGLDNPKMTQHGTLFLDMICGGNLIYICLPKFFSELINTKQLRSDQDPFFIYHPLKLTAKAPEK